MGLVIELRVLTNLPPPKIWHPRCPLVSPLKEGSSVSLTLILTLPPLGKSQVGEGSPPSSYQFIVNQALTLNFSLVPQPSFCSFV